MNKIRLYLLAIFCFHSTIGISQIKLPGLISDGAVLQRDVELKIWGWASPNEEVQLNFRNQQYTTQTDQDRISSTLFNHDVEMLFEVLEMY